MATNCNNTVTNMTTVTTTNFGAAFRAPSSGPDGTTVGGITVGTRQGSVAPPTPQVQAQVQNIQVEAQAAQRAAQPEPVVVTVGPLA